MSAPGERRGAVVAAALCCAVVLLTLAASLFAWSCGSGDSGDAKGPQGTEDVARGRLEAPSADENDVEEADGTYGREVQPVDEGVPGTLVTLPAVCAGHGDLVGTQRSPLGVRATWNVEVSLVECAKKIIEGYQAEGTVALEHDGYLDLLGRVWGCAVWSEEGWVELAFVEDRSADEEDSDDGDGGSSCMVTLVRFGQEAVAESS